MRISNHRLLFFSLIFFVLSIQLYGCGSSNETSPLQQTENEPPVESISSETIPDANPEGSSDNTDSIVEQDLMEEKESEEAGDQNHYAAHAANKIITFDADGNKLHEYDLNEVSEQFASKTRTYRIDPDECIAERNGILYYKQGELSLLAVKPETNEIKAIMTENGDSNIYGFDIYQDRLCFVHPRSYKASSGWNVHCFDIDYDAFKYNKCETKYNDFFSSIVRYEMLYPSIDSWNQKGLERTLDEYGYILARKDDKFYKLASDGTIMEIPGLSGEDSCIVTYDGSYAIYYEFDDSDEITGYYCTDLNTMESKKLSIDAANALFRAYIDGKL